MGSYGIGVSRAVAAIAEMTLRRARACLAARGRPGRRAHRRHRQGRRPAAPGRRAAGRRAARPPACGCCSTTAIGVSPGIKFNDAELIGVPTIVVVGRGLADGVVEVKDRRSGERRDVALDDAVSELRSALPGV